MGWEVEYDRMTASNVGDLATGPEIVLWLEEVVMGVHFLRVLGLEVVVAMGIASVNVIVMLTIVMMEDVLEIGTALTAGIANMATVINIIVTGIQVTMPYLLLRYSFCKFHASIHSIFKKFLFDIPFVVLHFEMP